MKLFRYILVAIGTTVILLTALLLCFFKPPVSKKYMERDFNKCKADIVLVTEFLASSIYDSVYIPDFDESGMVFVGLDEGDVHIDNTEIYAAIDRLINRCGYQVICKTENAVYFQRWSNKDNGRGIICSLNDCIPDETSLSFLTHIEALEESGWYYYEEDFSEWEKNHKSRE